MGVYRLDVAYDGSGFRGYARQPGQRTVQGELEKALETVLGAAVKTSVAGRTDAGVHARGQVVSFHGTAIEPRRLVRALNGLVGPEIGVRNLVEVGDDFDARHSALWRKYRYTIGLTDVGDPLTRNHVWTPGTRLDIEAMSSAAAEFIGEHDFSSFCKSVEGKSNVRRLDELILDSGPERLTIWVTANAFCHQMVRSIVGHLYDIGRGFAAMGSTVNVIAQRDRSAVATVAPAHGLTLWEVGY